MGRNTYAGAHIVFYKNTITDKNHKGELYEVTTVLLVKRTLDAPIHPGLWSLPGGKDNKDEKNDEKPDKSSEDTAIREVEEELMSVQEYNGKICIVKALKTSLKNIAYLCSVDNHVYFKAILNNEMDELILRRKYLKGHKKYLKDHNDNKVEGEGIGWFSEEEIWNMRIRPQDREALIKFFLTEKGVIKNATFSK